jgi:Pro-kumamolisin, activation domain
VGFLPGARSRNEQARANAENLPVQEDRLPCDTSSMMRRLGLALVVLPLALATQATALDAAEIGERARILITEKIDDGKLVALRGNTRPEALDPANDRGRVDDAFPMTHMLLQLRRPAELEQEFEQFIDQLTDKTSPNFRRWLMPAEQGQLYGPAEADLDRLKDWLESHGFTVNYIYPTGMVMDISGTAGQIRRAFHTEIHNLEVRGEPHYANVRDPLIPEALAPLVVGIVSMHNFKPQAMNRPRIDYTFAGCNGTCYSLAPADLQVIYSLDPLYRLGLNGTGQTIVVIEDSDTYSNDVATYRSTFLSKYTGTVTTIHPSGGNSCTDPGTNAADAEADLDAEVASAIAPNATIEVASCSDSTSTFGGLLAIENLVNSASPPALLSMSYGECEAVNGASSNAAFNSAFQTGAAAGVSIFASAGDAGASACAPDYGETSYAYPGIGVTGWGETVYNVSVGGTDFEDTYNATKGSPATPLSTYWNSTNTGTESSAKSYIPEIPWNDSCAGYLLYNYLGFATSYGSTGLCASATYADTLSTAAGSGGPSGCATGGGGTDQSHYAVVDGTCAGYAKPAWQSGIYGNPADGVRDIPDVSLFAANGIWGHYVTICFSDTTQKGSQPCTGAPNTWSGFGGTSVGAPMMASIQALVNEEWGIRAGNPNPTYYSIAKLEFGSTGDSACYSINQPPQEGLASSCVFYDITQGDNVVDCAYNGSNDSAGVGCYRPSGTYGSLSTQALTTGTVTAGGSGYTSAPTCTIGAPSNLNEYLSPAGGVLWAGGTQATCTAKVGGGAVSSVTIGTAGSGYAGGASCTLTGGGGTGATCSVSPVIGTVAPAYQPAYGATPGWDFATGIGSVNAYNLVFNSAW